MKTAVVVITIAFWCSSSAFCGEASFPSQRNFIVRFYQNYLSGADGSRCPMMPSCSEYAAQAVERHGPVIGWIMTCDRILRCGRSETELASRIRVQGRLYVHDPLSRNDFWWFEPRSGEGDTLP
jgi:putative membrane protein insertion efficiency factor